MDFLKKQLASLREQLTGLSASQKMLAGSLVVIMLMTLLWWGRYAGSSEMEAVLEQDFAQEDLARASALIASRNIPYKVVGHRIHVASDRKFEVLAMLGYEQLLPRNTESGFDQVLEKMNSPWNPDRTNDVMFNRAKEVMLAQILRNFPGVRNATVLVDNTTRRAFGDQNRQPSATVYLQTGNPGGRPKKQLVQAAADVVSGAVSGMMRSRVNVIVDGASYNAQDKDNDSLAGDTWMDLVKEGERHFSQKILDHLSYIPGVMVSVTVDPKMTSSQTEKETYEKSGIIEKPSEINEKTDESTNMTRPSGEPGMDANTGANMPVRIGAAAGASSTGSAAPAEGSTTNSTETKTKYQFFPSVIREWMKSPAGASAVVGAAVSLPRSHFVRIFKTSNPTAREPDDTALQPMIDSELRKIKAMVHTCMSKTPDEAISVDWYYDNMPSGGIGDSAQPASASSLPLSLASHTKEIALGALAVISLFMVSMMVKKSSPAPIPTPRPERKPPEPIVAGEDVAGEVGEGTQSLDGMELDDDALKTQQMITQVSTMVKDNPDAAASLVKRWLNRS